MSFGRSVSVLVIALTLGSFSLATAATTAPAAPVATPEMKMLESVSALQGSKLPQDLLRKQLSETMTAYFSSAPLAGQTARLQQALVTLGIYNENQAASFLGDSKNAPLTADQVERIADLHPMGAEFSSCAAESTGFVLTVVGSVGLIISVLSPHYPDSEAALAACGETGVPCSQTDYYHSDSDRNSEMIGTGIATALGALLLVLSPNGC